MSPRIETTSPPPIRLTAVPPARGAGRIQAGDRMASGTRITVLMRPLRVPPREQVVARVRALLELGPSARVGRILDERRWSYEPAAIEEHAERMVGRLPDDLGTAEDLPRLRERADPMLPLSLFLGTDRIAVLFDHRLGDGFFAVMVLAALFAEEGVPRVFEGADDRDPLPAALAATFGRHPSRAWNVVRDKLVTAPGAASGPSRVVDGPGSLALHATMMTPDAYRAFSAWTRGRMPRSAAIVAAFQAALRAEGIPVADSGIVLVDLRRYLPSGRATLANFVIGHPLDLRRGPDAAGAQLTRDLHLGRPLAALAVARRPVLRAAPTAETVPEAAVPIVSDMGLLRPLERLPWDGVDPQRPTIEVSVDPATRGGITALTTVLRGRFGVSLSFDSSIFPADRVVAAGERLCTAPLELLPA
ncbi:hypothetical protein [Microbacterium rhizophilus]|uniref:hypothetical protein n=1 Tax=Microbacterium rhizophilus TaxID=3138934 RepID=UPI0031ECA71C